jgi:hypothetical protein
MRRERGKAGHGSGSISSSKQEVAEEAIVRRIILARLGPIRDFFAESLHLAFRNEIEPTTPADRK